MSETAFSDKEAANIDEGWVEEVFCATVKAEERVVMMEELIKRGVGLAEVEHFFEAWSRRIPKWSIPSKFYVYLQHVTIWNPNPVSDLERKVWTDDNQGHIC